MNRPYDRERYLDLINYARRVMPELVLTSDIIIGFPGEQEHEAMETVSLVREVEFDALFTFLGRWSCLATWPQRAMVSKSL